MEIARRWRLVVAELGWPSLIALALSAIVGIGGWIVLVLDKDPAWSEYFALYLGTVVAANTLVSSLLFLSPFSKTEEKGTRMTLLVILAPLVLTALVTAAITPPDLSTAGFGTDFPALAVIATLALLGLGATLCGLLGYFFVVFPIVLLIRAVRPGTSRTASSVLYEGLGRRQLVALAVALITVVVFAIFMTNVSDEGGSRAQRRHADVVELFTLTGNPGAIVGVALSVAVLVVAIIVAARPRAAS